MSKPLTLVWFRQDLRLADNPALLAATERGEVLPVYIWAPEEEGDWAPGGASRWWLHYSLESLQLELQDLDSRLVLRSGKSLEVLKSLIEETGATAVYWNRRYEPAIIKRDTKIKKELQSQDCEVQSFNASLLFEPWEIENKQGKPYQVFTPFWKQCNALDAELDPADAPDALPHSGKWPKSEKLADLELLPAIDWDKGIRAAWQVGTSAAQQQLEQFVAKACSDYKDDRNLLGEPGTSRLSPYLHFGEIGPRQIWAEVQAALAAKNVNKKGAETFLSEIGWREFGYHLLYHFPQTATQPLREQFEDFPWESDKQQLRRWRRGQTGYPVVDAAMRELWHTGWMHNRARMIVASFLCKHLLIPWQRGAEWFWDTLVDADLASNTLGWQWTAGCGADAAPYFRIFNPITQGEKFDPKGKYVRHWVPELAGLPDKWLNSPWEAPEEVLEQAGVTLGETYPHPVVEHGEARQAALDAYEEIRQG